MTNFRSAILEESGCLDYNAIEKEVLQISEKMVSNNPSVCIIVLECSNLPPYAHAIQKATGLPVFDFTSLINYVHMALHRAPFSGPYWFITLKGKTLDQDITEKSQLNQRKIPPKIIGSPGRYIQGAGATGLLGQILDDLGWKPLIISDDIVWSILGERFIDAILFADALDQEKKNKDKSF